MSVKKGDRVKYGARAGVVLEIRDGASSAIVKWDKSGDAVGKQSEVAINVLEKDAGSPEPTTSAPQAEATVSQDTAAQTEAKAPADQKAVAPKKLFQWTTKKD